MFMICRCLMNNQVTCAKQDQLLTQNNIKGLDIMELLCRKHV